jgi:hypothetical protein
VTDVILLLLFLSDVLNSMYIFDTLLLRWSQTVPWNFSSALAGGKLATLNGKVLVCGGNDGEIFIQRSDHEI